jgi:hypothetical protein
VQEPHDRELISDVLRRQLNVPTLAEQQALIQKLAGK